MYTHAHVHMPMDMDMDMNMNTNERARAAERERCRLARARVSSERAARARLQLHEADRLEHEHLLVVAEQRHVQHHVEGVHARRARVPARGRRARARAARAATSRLPQRGEDEHLQLQQLVQQLVDLQRVLRQVDAQPLVEHTRVGSKNSARLDGLGAVRGVAVGRRCRENQQPRRWRRAASSPRP